MQNREHGTVGARVQELVGMPRRRERPGFRFAIADHASDEQIRVVEYGAERVAERVPELAALMDRPWTLRGRMARNPARKRELRKELLEPSLIAADVRINLAVSPFEVRVAHHRRTAVAGTGDVDHGKVIF